MPANTSWVVENSGPGALVVNVGRTRHSVASVITLARAVAEPSALNDVVPRRSWDQCRLLEGDQIEIVTFVGGG